MLGPPTPLDFLPDIPTGYKIAYYPERLQPYTIWKGDKVARFEGVELTARKWVEAEAARARYDAVPDWHNQQPLTTSINYWEFPKSIFDRAAVIE